MLMFILVKFKNTLVSRNLITVFYSKYLNSFIWAVYSDPNMHIIRMTKVSRDLKKITKRVYSVDLLVYAYCMLLFVLFYSLREKTVFLLF